MQSVGSSGAAASSAPASVEARLLLGLLVRGALLPIAGVARALLATLGPGASALTQLALDEAHVKGPGILLLALPALVPLLTWFHTGSFGSQNSVSASFAGSFEHCGR